ncbi:MAG: hypothetical protein EZS28_004570 [Streblomastix strix]|uniref:Uncharacterized protein n=1 Tax=Streblomastix strix TaxID=222440 RepID=A0A5J4WYD5_9EUKA|nr:MAG: hypothetical protein EZS28_004570 [Streblomastix strix]
MQESIPIKEEMLKAYHRQPLIGGGNRNNMDEDKDGENGQQGKDDLYVQNDVIVMMQQMLSEQQNKQHQDENVQPTLLEKVVMGHEGAITGLVPLPGTIHTIASSSNDGLILLWDVTKEKVRNVLRKHTRAVTCLIWHPQAQLLISGGADNMIHVWNPFVSRNVFSHTFRGHRAIVCAINTIPNTNEFVSMSRDGGVRVWDVKSTLLIQTFSVDIEGIIGGTPDGDSLSITATKGSNISGVGLKQNMSKQQNLAVLKEIQKAQTVINESGPAIKECTALSICGDLSNRLIVAGPRRLAFFDFFCLGKVNQDTVDDVVVGDDQDNGEADEEDIDNFVAVEKKRIDRQKKNLLENMAKGLRIEKRKKAGAIQNDYTVGQQSSTKNVVGSEIGSIGKKKNFRSEEKKAQLSVTRTAMARGGHYIGIASDNNPFANKRSDGDGEGNVGQILGNAVSSQLAGDGLEQVRSKSGKALQTLLGRSKVQQLEVSLSTHFGYSSTGKKSKVSARPIRSAVYNELYGTIATAVENSTRLFDAHTGYQNGQYEMENLVTALSIDGRQRKLYVGTVEGTVKVYKFNNGALMTELERHVGQPPNAEIVEEEEKTNVDKEVEEEEKIEDEEENKEKEIEKDKEKEQGKNKDQVKIKDKEKEEKVDKDKEKDKDKSQQQQQQSIQPTPKPKSKIKAKAKVNSNLKKKKKQEGDEDDDDEDEQDEDEGEGKKKNSVPITSIQYIDYLGMCFSTSWERRAILASDTEDTVRFISPLSGDLCCGAICESEDMGHVGTGASDKTIRLFDAKSCQMTAQFIADHDVSALSFIGSFPLVISGDSDGVLQMWSYKPCSSRTMVARWINVEQYKLRERNREKEREVAEQEEKERAQLILQQQQQGMNQNLRQRMQMMKQKTFVGGTLGSPQQASTATIVSPNSSQQPPYVNKQQLSNSASGATISTVQQLQVKINQTGSVQEVQGERMTVGITKLCFISNFKMVKTIKREQDGKKNKKKKKKADLEKEQQEKKDEQIQLSITEKQIQDDEKLDFSVDFEDESEQNTTTSEQEEGKMPLLQDAMDQISEDEEDQEQKKKERALLKAQGMSYKRSSQYSQRQSKVNILLNKNNKLTQSNSSITQDDDEEDEESESESSGEIDGEYATLIKQKGSGENDQSKQQKRKKKEEQEKDQQNQNDGEEKDEQKPNVVIREKIKVPKVRKYGQLVVVGDEQGFVTIYNVAWIIAELGIKRIEEYIKEKEKEAEEQGGQFKKEEGTNFSVHYHPLKKTRFRAHKDSITSLQYIPLNEALLTSSLDGHICIWHLGKFVRSLQQAKRAGGRNMKFTGRKFKRRLIQQQWHADVIEENGYYNIWWNGCIRPIRRLPQCLGRIHSIKGVVERYKPIDAWGWGSLGLWWDGQSDKLEQIDRKLALEKAGLDFQDKENDEDNYKLDSKRSKSSIGAYEKNSFASGNMSSIFSGIIQEKVNEILDHIGKMLFDKRKEKEETAGGDFGNGLIVQAKHHEEKEKDNKWKKPKSKQKRKKEKVGEDKDEKEEEKDKSKDSEQEINEKEKNKKDNISTFFITSTGQSDDQNQSSKAPLGSLRIPLQTHQGRLKSPTWRQMRVDKQNEILMQREQQTELDKEKQRQQQLLIDRGIQAATQGQQGRDYRSISSTGQSVSSSINTNDWRGAVQSIGTTSIQTTVDQSQNRSQISSQKIPQTAISLNTRDTQDRNVDLEFEDSLFSEGISTIKQKKQEIQKEMELIAEKQYPNRSASCDPYQEKKKRMDQLMKSSIYVSNYEELKKQRQDKKKIMEQVYGYGSPEMLLYQQIGDPTQRSQSRSPSPSPEGNISPISWKSQDVFSSHFGNQSLSTRYPQLQSEQQRRSNPIKSQDSSHTGTTSNQQSIISYNSTTFNKLNLPLPARSTTGSVDKRVSPTRGSIGVNKVDYVRRSFNFQQKAPKQIQPMRQSYNTTGRTTSPLIDYDTIDVDEEILRLKRILLPQLNNEPRRTQSPLQRPNS